MSAVKIGIQVHPQHCTFADYRKAWLALDELGVDTIWTWDHFFPLYGYRNGPHFEGWTTLSVLGALTKQATVGCLVLCMSYRNAALLSQMSKTLDHAVDGRLILGVGAGWAERDYNEYGYEFGSPGTRLKNLERSLEIIKNRWAIDPPPPLHGTIPILVGGGGEKVTLRITAQHGDLWNGFGPLESWVNKNTILDDWCKKVGRDPAAIERTITLPEGAVPNASELEAWVAAGASHLIYRIGAPFDLAPVKQLLAWREGRV